MAEARPCIVAELKRALRERGLTYAAVGAAAVAEPGDA